MQKLFFLSLLWVILLASCGAGAKVPATPTSDPIVIKGQTVFQAHCATCHALTADTIIVGPSLAGIAPRAAERDTNLSAKQYLEISILHPEAHIVEGFADAMPKDFGKKLTGEELDSVIIYLLTLQ